MNLDVKHSLGDYTLVKSIGQGALGSVYLAEHRFMKKHYALKILPVSLSEDRVAVQRFQEEVNRLSSLEHPHIVRVHNISFANGFYFLVTDCIVDSLGETTNLAHYLAENRQKVDEETIYKIASQIAEALDYAHKKFSGDRQVVHGGLKLNNILMGKGKGSVEVYISDFGLTDIISPGAVLMWTLKSVADTHLAANTLFAEVEGDSENYPVMEGGKQAALQQSFFQHYHFFAPEQKRVDGAAVSCNYKSDIYAFGVLVYYMLSGEYPQGAFDLPSEFARGHKRNWDPLIKSCLAFQPEKRPGSLAEAMKLMEQDVLGSHRFQQQRAVLERGVQPAEKTPSHDEEKILSTPLKPLIQQSELRPAVFDPDPAAAFIVDPNITTFQPEPRKDVVIDPIQTEMVIIPAGEYFRGSQEGSRDEIPSHKIYLDSYAIDLHPVTNEQFVRFLDAMGGEKDRSNHDLIRLKESRIRRRSGKLNIESGYSKHPVVGVTWYGAVAYAKWVGKRLPTEAEWEIAAKSFCEAIYPTGDKIEKSQANFFSSDSTAVMSYPPNVIGLYDMAGNVYEWCQDWYAYNYYETSMQEPDNPLGPLQGVYRVLRGGCWKSLKEDLRCAHRHRNNPGTANGTYGFRCAADVV